MKLRIARRERFAQHLADGMSEIEAHLSAGYARQPNGCKTNAVILARHAEIVARVKEIREGDVSQHFTKPPGAGLGYLYMMVNASMPFQYKIGLSVHPLLQRIDALSKTSAPTRFVPLAAIEVTCVAEKEKEVHKNLHEYRSPGREFFNAPHSAILDEYARVVRDCPTSKTYFDHSLQFPEFWDGAFRPPLTVEEKMLVQVQGFVDKTRERFSSSNVHDIPDKKIVKVIVGRFTGSGEELTIPIPYGDPGEMESILNATHQFYTSAYASFSDIAA